MTGTLSVKITVQELDLQTAALAKTGLLSLNLTPVIVSMLFHQFLI